MRRDLLSIGLISTAAVAAGALWSCTSQASDPEQDELQALLHDEPLNQVPPGISNVANRAADLPGDAGVPPPPADAPPSEPPPDGGTGSGGGSGSGSGGGGEMPPPSGPALSTWSFDDCNPSRTNLFDANRFNIAFRSVGVACAPGIHGTPAVAIAAKEDIVYVPDQPDFTFENGVTVAGWFNPTAASGTRTLFRKRDKDTSSFALLLNSGRFQLVINLGHRAISVTAPTRAKLGQFQHVAGTYDGTTARLYVDTVEVANRAATGVIPPGPGPVLMGNDGSERRFAGTIDSTAFATRALSASEVAQLTCVQAAPTVSFPSDDLAPTPIGVPATVDVAITNHSDAVCGPIEFQLFAAPFTSSLSVNVQPSVSVPAGTTLNVKFAATPTEIAEPGSDLQFQATVIDPISPAFLFQSYTVHVAESTGCRVNTLRELMITNTSVVDDPIRTASNPSSSDPRNGAWTFKHLVENMAPTPADAPAMVEAILTSMTRSQTINGFALDTRPGMQSLILDRWPRTPDGALDLAKAPLRLQAIVNRFDLRNLSHGDGGEGRFVFAFEANGFPLQATMIFEYKLPASSDADVLGWATSFHNLGTLPFGEDYNAALQAITERFVGRGVRPDHPNGNAINAVRINEIDFGANGLWELREFHLSAATARLEPSPLELTPDRSFDNTATLAAYINANQAEIIAETHTVPAVFQGQSFQAGAVFNPLTTWFAPGVTPEARHHFALNTCNGCHSSQETGVGFLQISPRFPGSPSQLSGFLTGTTIPDPVTGVPRTFNDLGRRNADLKSIVCSDPAAKSFSKANLRKGISRVH